MRKIYPCLFAGIALVFVLSGFAASASASDRSFSLRFSANDTGNIDMAANTLMTCPASASGCLDARQGPMSNTTTTSNLQNNFYAMEYVDVDGDSSTFNSSTADLNLPSGSTVLFAGLYWGGDLGGSGSNAPPNSSNSNKALFKVPGTPGYTAVTATTYDESSTQSGRYQGFVDVTTLVKAAGSGTYGVANVQAARGGDKYAGWSLIVAYRDTSQPARNLSVFDGLKSITSSGSQNITVSGFQTPPAGSVKTSLGFVTYEGDLGITGDTASLNGTQLGDAQSPKTNFFNSSIAKNGSQVTTKNPNYANQLALDADIFNADGILGNNATSATITVSTSGDVYIPGVITFATELYAPKIEQTKTAVDLNGGQLVAGDELEYRISGTNNGQDGADNFKIRDAIPSGTTYVPGSLKVVSGASSTGSKTDAADSDLAELDSGGAGVTFRVGTGANGTQGGRISPGSSYEVRFRVKVADGLTDGSTIHNTAVSTFNSQSLNTPLRAESSADSTVAAPDLTILKSRTSGPLVVGQPATWNLKVSNVGSSPSVGTVTVTDTLPAQFVPTAASGTGWSCSIASQTVTCTRSNALGAGNDYPNINLTANVVSGGGTSVSNTATVSGGGDPNSSNNSSTDTGTPAESADISVVKSASPTTIGSGETTTFSLLVHNAGASAAQNVSVSDQLPPGFSLVSADPRCNATLVCDLGTLASGASTTVEIVARAGAATAGTTVTNKATASSPTPDPNSTNNTSRADVVVKATDLGITKTVTPTAPAAGGPISYLITVTSKGPGGAHDVLITDDLPAQLENASVTVVSGGASCDPVTPGGQITCTVPSLAVGEKVELKVDATVKAGTGAVTIDNNASVSSAEPDADPSDNTAVASATVAGAADLSIVKTAPGRIDPGGTGTYTLDVHNDGPATATSVVVTDDLPAGVSPVTPLPPGCSYAAAQNRITCNLGSLASGADRSISLTVRVGSGVAGTIRNTASVSSPTSDPDPSDNTSSADTTVPSSTDLSITKSVNPGAVETGETAIFTLKVHNDGPGAARNTIVSDPLPAGLEFVSSTPGAPDCTVSSGAVACELGDIPAGGDRTVLVTVRATATTTTPSHQHLLPVEKAETQIDLDPGQTRTIEASCPSAGRMVTDGSVRIDAVDQGTGTLADVAVVSTEAIDQDTYRATVRNDATGRAQAKLFATCIPTRTEPENGHTHPLILGATQSASSTVPVGRSTITVACGAGQQPIAPSFTSSGGNVRLYASEQTASGWSFGVEATNDAADVSVSVRCLERRTGVVDGHSHPLPLSHPVRTVTVPAGATVSEQVICGDLEKGIVATWKLGAGLVLLGHDPQPKTRVFKLYNPTSSPIDATLDLVCIGDRTGGPITVDNATNSATVSSDTPDIDTTNNSASASLQISATDGGGGGGGGGAPFAAPGDFASKAASSSGGKKPKLSFTVECDEADGDCGGKVRVSTLRRLKKAKIRSGGIIGRGRYEVSSGDAGKVTVKIGKRAWRSLRKQKIHKVRVELRNGTEFRKQDLRIRKHKRKR